MDIGNWLSAHKPAASAGTHALLAASMWTLVGTVLTLVGMRWAIGSGMSYAWVFIAAAALLGVIKSRLVLERTADRAVARIRERGDGRCVGGFFSLRSWAFVAVMAGLGRALRGGLLPRYVVGLLYVAVGIALAMASRRLWAGWYRMRAGTPD